MQLEIKEKRRKLLYKFGKRQPEKQKTVSSNLIFCKMVYRETYVSVNRIQKKIITKLEKHRLEEKKIKEEKRNKNICK